MVFPCRELEVKRWEFKARFCDLYDLKPELGHVMVTAVVWKDNRLSYFLSTVCNVDKCNVTRRNKKGVEEMVEAPDLVKMYNQKMGGVDRGDQGK